MLVRAKLLGRLLAFTAVLSSTAAAQRAYPDLHRPQGGSYYASELAWAPAAPTAYSSRAACAPRPTWVPGHFELVKRKVWIRGECRRIWLPAVFETRIGPCGRPIRVLRVAAHWTTVEDPGHFEDRCERVWVAGQWAFLRS